MIVCDVAIIGGGITGLVSAWEFVQQGRSVAIVSKPRSEEAESIVPAVLSPLRPWELHSAVNRLIADSKAIYPTLLKPLVAQTHVDLRYWTCGAWVSQEEHPDVSGWLSAYNVSGKWVEAQSMPKYTGIERHEPGLWMRETAQLNLSAFIHALSMYLQNHSSVAWLESADARLRLGQDKVLGIEVDGEKYATEAVVLATGSNAGGLVDVDISPEYFQLGQYALFEAEHELQCVYVESDRHLIPILPNKLLYAIHLDEVTESSVPLALNGEGMLKQLYEMLPNLNKSVRLLNTWATVQGALGKQNIPLICESPQYKRLFFSLGYHHYGVQCAPAAAKLLVKLVDRDDGDSFDHRPYCFLNRSDCE